MELGPIAYLIWYHGWAISTKSCYKCIFSLTTLSSLGTAIVQKNQLAELP